MAGKSENVAIFNPLVLPLPNWHPDGPDGSIDGFVIPFVFVENRVAGPVPNRRAQIRVYPGDHGWRASLRNCQDHAETAEQARAFAGAWIRAAELLDNVGANEHVVDAEVVEDDEEQADTFVRQCCATPLAGPHTPGCWLEPREDRPINYDGPVEVLDGVEDARFRKDGL